AAVDERAELAAAGDEDQTVAAFDAAQRLAAVEAAVRTLRKPEHQQIVVAALFTDTSRDEIARMFETSRNNVDQIVKRFRARFGDLLP
ncbi:MAG TPA: hypothetical protein VHB21_03870, partial [Minicystis sp.]|nr:hypothetical protein [Minicystis sp.]